MIELYVSSEQKLVDTEDIKNISINYSVKDIKNYGQRNISHTKPVKVLRTKATEAVMAGLFNINVTNSYDITQFTPARLVEDGIVILDGLLYVDEIYPDYYNVVIESPQFNLYEDMGDSLIVNNDVSTNDIMFADDYFKFAYNRDAIRTQLKESSFTPGEGYRFTIIDHNNNLNDYKDISDDYVILPSIAVKELFDEIFNKYGYTYNMSTELKDILKQMYMPMNNDIYQFTEDTAIKSYMFGAPDKVGRNSTGTVSGNGYYTVIRNKATSTHYAHGSLFGQFIPCGSFDEYFDKPLDPSITCPGGIYSDPLTHPGWQPADAYIPRSAYGIPIQKTGIYDVQINLLYGTPYNLSYPSNNWTKQTKADTDVTLNVMRAQTTRMGSAAYYKSDTLQTFDVGTLKADEIGTDTSIGYLTKTIKGVYMKVGDVFCTATNVGDEELDADDNRLDICYDPSSCVLIREQNSLMYSDVSLNLNAMRPTAYKQKDLINDILTIFNAYIEVGDENNVLNIKSYNEFNASATKLDWSNKLDLDSLKIDSLPNNFSHDLTFNFQRDDDLYNKDFFDKYGKTFGDKIILNESELSSGESSVKLNIASTVFKTVDDTFED